MKHFKIPPPWRAALLLLSSIAATLHAGVVEDRAAIENIYQENRSLTDPSRETSLSPAMIAELVRKDQHKEAVLKDNYGVAITAAMLDAEVRRIDATTRAAGVLAEIKHALGDDTPRFADCVARPIIVERELRRCFCNDDKLHATQRQAADIARSDLLDHQSVAGAIEATWSLKPRPAGEAPSASVPGANPTKGNASSATYTNEATATPSQVLSSPAPRETELWFEDLDPELQNVLRVQLVKAGDVSAVIEDAGGFRVFQAKSITTDSLQVISISIPKRSYDEWLTTMP